MIDNIGYITSYSGGTSLLIGGTYSFTSECRMGFTGELPVMLTMRKSNNDEPDPYLEWLEMQKETVKEDTK